MTKEMVAALWRQLPSEVQEGREPDDIHSWVDAVLTAVEQDLPTGPTMVTVEVGDFTGAPVSQYRLPVDGTHRQTMDGGQWIAVWP